MKNLAVIGGGPVGLSLALLLERKGHKVTVFEKKQWPVDKVCGQGIMPSGIDILRELGLENMAPRAELYGVEYIENEIRIRGNAKSNIWGVERKILSKALYLKAKKVSNIILVDNKKVELSKKNSKFLLNDAEFDYIFACDGLNSPSRKKLDNNIIRTGNLRVGARFHIDKKNTDKYVKIFWNNRIEAYVTPVSEERIEIAFLWYENRIKKGSDLLNRLIEEFPEIKKIINTENIQDFKAYGPFREYSRKVKIENVFFIGDAYHFHDGITGEGISLGLKMANLISNSFEHFGILEIIKLKLLYGNYRLWVSFALINTRYSIFRKCTFCILKRFSKLFNIILSINDFRHR